MVAEACMGESMQVWEQYQLLPNAAATGIDPVQAVTLLRAAVLQRPGCMLGKAGLVWTCSSTGFLTPCTLLLAALLRIWRWHRWLLARHKVRRPGHQYHMHPPMI